MKGQGPHNQYGGGPQTKELVSIAAEQESFYSLKRP
jgi:hypothetical protein